MSFDVFAIALLGDKRTEYHVTSTEGEPSKGQFYLLTGEMEVVKKPAYLEQAFAYVANQIEWESNPKQELTLSITLNQIHPSDSTPFGSLKKTFSNKADLVAYLATQPLKKDQAPKNVLEIEALFVRSEKWRRAKIASVPLFFALSFWGFCAMDGAMVYAASIMAGVTLTFIACLVVSVLGDKMRARATADRNYHICRSVVCRFKKKENPSWQSASLEADSPSSGEKAGDDDEIALLDPHGPPSRPVDSHSGRTHIGHFFANIQREGQRAAKKNWKSLLRRARGLGQ